MKPHCTSSLMAVFVNHLGAFGDLLGAIGAQSNCFDAKGDRVQAGLGAHGRSVPVPEAFTNLLRKILWERPLSWIAEIL